MKNSLNFMLGAKSGPRYTDTSADAAETTTPLADSSIHDRQVNVKRYTLELYNDYSYLALYKFFDFHSCLNVDI